MKRIIFLFILVLTFSCKDEKKKEKEAVTPVVNEKQYKTIKSFTSDDLIKWSKTRIELTPVTDAEYRDTPYRLSRSTITESSYLSSGYIPATYGSEYRASIIVKKGTGTDFFGLRISGIYPDRVDAIFNLEEGKVVQFKASQDFEKPKATIEKLSGNRYNCTLSAEVTADNVRVIIGATSKENSVTSWEGETKTQGDVFIAPSSIVLEELMLN